MGLKMPTKGGGHYIDKPKRKKSKRSTTPAVRYLRYELTNSGTPGTETSHYIDLARDLSRVNRRLYRQGRDYHVKRITIVSSNTNQNQGADPAPGTNAGRITVGTIAGGWVSRQAWSRGFRTWNDMNHKHTRAVSSNIAGTWSDFKVYLSREMQTGTVLTPIDNGGNAYNAGDWDYSELVSPDGTTSADPFLLHMLGDHVGSAGSYTSVGLIKSYGESRATVDTDQPNVQSDVSADPLVNVFDDGTVTDEVIDDLEGQNDSAPYGTNNYPGDNGNAPKPIVVQQTTLGTDGKCTVGGFSALCGLLELETTSPLGNDVYSVLVELAPGSYRGLKAEVI